jgi:Phage integrase family.
MTSLPQDLEDFFAAAAIAANSERRPHWLHSALADPVWKVASSARARKVNGVWRNLTELRWDLRLPTGRLSDATHRILLEDGKALLLSAFTGPESLPPSRLAAFHHRLISTLEFLAVQHYEAAIRSGVRAMSWDVCREYVVQFKEGGVSATAGMNARWEAFMVNLMKDDRLACGRPSQAQDSLRAAKDALARIGFYDRHGRLIAAKVAEAVSTSPRRYARLIAFRTYLERYQLRDEAKGSSPKWRAVDQEYWNTDGVVAWVLRCGIAARSTHLQDWELCDVAAVREHLTFLKVSSRTRTKTIPPSVAKQLVSGCVDWLMCHGEALTCFVEHLLDHMSSVPPSSNSAVARMEAAFASIPLPTGLKDLNVDGVWRTGRFGWHDQYANGDALTVCDLLDIHTAVCFAVIALFTCSRKSEVLELEDDDVWQRAGRWHVEVALRKTGRQGMRRHVSKPAPPLVGAAVNSLVRIRRALLAVASIDDTLLARRLFFSVVRTERLIDTLVPASIYSKLALLSGWLDLRDHNGKRWHIRPHQLRRLFAMSFFHFGGLENSLPALSWMMGHEEMYRTWTYIQEDLTGSEISSVEASLAANAVRSDDDRLALEQLRNLLRRHFGVSDLAVLDESELHDYLELLQSQGVYTARPGQIRTSEGVRYTVFIHLKREEL